MKLLFSIPLIFLFSCKNPNFDPNLTEFCPQNGNTIAIKIDKDEKHCLDWSEASRIYDDKLQIFQIKYGNTWNETVRLELIASGFKGKGKYNIIVKEFTNKWNGKNDQYKNNDSIPNGTIKIIKFEESNDQRDYFIEGEFNFKIKYTSGKVSTIKSYFKSLKVYKY